MSEILEGISEAPSMQEKPSLPHISRRQLLRTMAAGSVALAGGAALTACGGSSSPATVKVTFYTNAWPGDSMPTAAQQKSTPSLKSYADSLTKWLNQNPGVTIKHTQTSVWDSKGLPTAISAGTAPTWYEGNVLGAFQNLQTIEAFGRGLAADVTSLVDKYQITQQVTTYAMPTWKSWQVNGKYYGMPAGYGVGDGVYYRRDLIQQAGLPEPTPDWTWTDFRRYAKALTKGNMKGAALESYIFSLGLFANQLATGPESYGTLGIIPSPNSSWHWKFDLTSLTATYKALTDNWRGMLYDDKSILTGTTYGGTEVAEAFIRGDVAMMDDNTGQLTQSPDQPSSVVQLAKRLNKPLDDVVGWVSNPKGELGSFGGTQPIMALGSIDPHFQRNPAALDKAFNFLVYMLIGQGATDQAVATYQQTKDLKYVYVAVPPMVTSQASYPGVPGTATDAWGTNLMQAIQAAGKIPLIPDPSQYIPADPNAPTGDAFNDGITGLNSTQKDVATILSSLQTTSNQQVAGLTSSASSATFTKAAQKFYSDLNTFWQKNAPDFYTNAFQPWYEQNVAPVLGG